MKTGLIVLTVLVAHVSLGATLMLEGEYSLKEGEYKALQAEIFYDIKSTVTLKCRADEPVANTIKWFKNNTNIKDLMKAEDEHYKIETVGKKESKLIITKIGNSDAGPYSCRAKGNDMVNFELVGKVAVKLPSNTMTVEGETLRIHCASAGTKIGIVWKISTLGGNLEVNMEGETEEVTVEEEDSKRFTVEDDGDVKNAVLVISDVSKQDRGHYSCIGKHLEDIDSDHNATTTTYVRVKDKLAALWPFLGICTNMFLLCLIIFISERSRKNKAADDEDSDTEQSDNRYESKNRYRK